MDKNICMYYNIYIYIYIHILTLSNHQKGQQEPGMMEFYIIVKLQSIKVWWSEGVRRGDMLNVFLVLIRKTAPTTLQMQ